MKKILFLTDFSDVSENAFLYALHFADTLSAEVHIVHITHIIEAEDKKDIHPLAAMYNKQLESYERTYFRQGEKKLNKIAHYYDKQSVPLHFYFEKGYFLKTILQDIAHHEIDFLVMGTAGADNIDKKLFGSHTFNVINEIEIPLLAIPKNAVFHQIKNYAVAVMLHQEELEIIGNIVRDLNSINEVLSLVHIVSNETELKKAKAIADGWLHNSGITHSIKLDIIISNSISKGLMHYCQKQDTDILCILHRNLSYFERLLRTSYSKLLLDNSETALLIYQ